MQNLISYLITLLTFAILGRVIFDWLLVGGVMKNDSPLTVVRNLLVQITEPILAPLRRFARIGTIDLSPMVAIIILNVMSSLVS
jgi:YggT family protein